MNLKVFFMNRIQGKILTHLENGQALTEVLLCPVEAEGDVRSSWTKVVGAASVKKQKTKNKTSQDCPSEQTQHQVEYQGKDHLADS